jgi:hypothetical protein
MLRLLDPHDQIVAVLHDAIENSDLTIDDLVGDGYPADVVLAIDCLTHRSGEPYERYIDRVAENEVARRVKIEHIRENLANNLRTPSNPGNAERIDRYRRALERLGATGP